MLVSSGHAKDGHVISPGVWRLTWRVARGWHCKVPAIQIRVTRVPRTPRMPPAHDFNLHTHVKYFWQSQLTEFWSRGQEKYGDRKSWNWRKNQHYKPAWHQHWGGVNSKIGFKYRVTLQNTWLSKDCTKSLTLLLWFWLTSGEDEGSRKAFWRQMFDCCADLRGFRGRVSEWYWLCNRNNEIKSQCIDINTSACEVHDL